MTARLVQFRPRPQEAIREMDNHNFAWGGGILALWLVVLFGCGLVWREIIHVVGTWL